MDVSKQCLDLPIIRSLVHDDCDISLVHGGNDNASLSALMAFCSSGKRLLGGGLDLARQPAILVLVSCASGGHTLLRPLSTAVMISGTGIPLGAGAKFKPLANTPFSATDRGLDDRLTTHLSLGCRGCDGFLFCCSLHFSVLSC